MYGAWAQGAIFTRTVLIALLVLLVLVGLLALAAYFFKDKWGCVRAAASGAVARAQAGAKQAHAGAANSGVVAEGGCCAGFLDHFGGYHRQLLGCVTAGREEQLLGLGWCTRCAALSFLCLSPCVSRPHTPRHARPPLPPCEWPLAAARGGCVGGGSGGVGGGLTSVSCESI